MNKYGYDLILKELVDDLLILETDGIFINNEKIKGSVTYLVADSLGANSICGLIESFSSNGKILPQLNNLKK